MTNSQCGICKNTGASKREADTPFIFECKCKVCGTYKIDRSLSDGTDNILNEDELHRLSCYLREISEYGLTSETLVRGNLKEICSSVKIPTTMLEKAHKIIQYMGEKSKTFGQSVVIDPAYDYPIAYALDGKELIFLLQYLKESGYKTEKDPDRRRTVLTMRGWQLFEENKKRQPDSKQCFVAMSFDDDLDEIYEQGIKKAIEAAGYESIRVDKVEHDEKVCDRIIAEIRKSRFIVADFTKQKQGVYFEAGFAKGLNIDVIWLCRKDEVDAKKLHFDTRQYNHITWENAQDLYKQLLERIKATIV